MDEEALVLQQMLADLGTARREKITTAVDRGARSFPSTTFAVPKPSSQNEATSSWLSSCKDLIQKDGHGEKLEDIANGQAHRARIQAEIQSGPSHSRGFPSSRGGRNVNGRGGGFAGGGRGLLHSTDRVPGNRPLDPAVDPNRVYIYKTKRGNGGASYNSDSAQNRGASRLQSQTLQRVGPVTTHAAFKSDGGEFVKLTSKKKQPSRIKKRRVIAASQQSSLQLLGNFRSDGSVNPLPGRTAIGGAQRQASLPTPASVQQATVNVSALLEARKGPRAQWSPKTATTMQTVAAPDTNIAARPAAELGTKRPLDEASETRIVPLWELRDSEPLLESEFSSATSTSTRSPSISLSSPTKLLNKEPDVDDLIERLKHGFNVPLTASLHNGRSSSSRGLLGAFGSAPFSSGSIHDVEATAVANIASPDEPARKLRLETSYPPSSKPSLNGPSEQAHSSQQASGNVRTLSVNNTNRAPIIKSAEIQLVGDLIDISEGNGSSHDDAAVQISNELADIDFSDAPANVKHSTNDIPESPSSDAASFVTASPEVSNSADFASQNHRSDISPAKSDQTVSKHELISKWSDDVAKPEAESQSNTGSVNQDGKNHAKKSQLVVAKIPALTNPDGTVFIKKHRKSITKTRKPVFQQPKDKPLVSRWGDDSDDSAQGIVQQAPTYVRPYDKFKNHVPPSKEEIMKVQGGSGPSPLRRKPLWSATHHPDDNLLPPNPYFYTQMTDEQKKKFPPPPELKKPWEYEPEPKTLAEQEERLKAKGWPVMTYSHNKRLARLGDQVGPLVDAANAEKEAYAAQLAPRNTQKLAAVNRPSQPQQHKNLQIKAPEVKHHRAKTPEVKNQQAPHVPHKLRSIVETQNEVLKVVNGSMAQHTNQSVGPQVSLQATDARPPAAVQQSNTVETKYQRSPAPVVKVGLNGTQAKIAEAHRTASHLSKNGLVTVPANVPVKAVSKTLSANGPEARHQKAAAVLPKTRLNTVPAKSPHVQHQRAPASTPKTEMKKVSANAKVEAQYRIPAATRSTTTAPSASSLSSVKSGSNAPHRPKRLVSRWGDDSD